MCSHVFDRFAKINPQKETLAVFKNRDSLTVWEELEQTRFSSSIYASHSLPETKRINCPSRRTIKAVADA